MKKNIGIGTVALVGLAVWALTKKAGIAQAANALMTGDTHPSYPSEYERLHTVVPITGYVGKEIAVFSSFDQYQEANNG